MAIYEVTARTITTAPPEHVWAILDDVTAWPTWMPGLENVQVDPLSEGVPRPGYQFRLTGKISLVHTDLEVTGFGPLERTTTFKVSFPPLTGGNSCVLVPLDDGRYQMQRVDYLHLPKLFASFLDRTQRERFERLAREFLGALKTAAEEHATHGAAANR
jgi:hypothetical protein